MANYLVALLGENVQNKAKENVAVTSLGGEGKVLGLYFSAHWCPPCKTFTPKLAQFYERFKDGANGQLFDIIFISSDKDEKQFDEYFKEMPWLALPFVDRERKNSISRKFKVSGIPTLIFLDGATGKLITSDGRSVVTSDAKGENFPWKPKPFADVIKGTLINNKEEEFTYETLAGKVTGLYFSAHWCPPCKAFTPRLIETYTKIKAAGKNFEIIFMSSDRSRESFTKYFATMPWLAVPIGDSRINTLSNFFGISGIPSLIILDESGNVICTNGRSAVSSDPEGKDFPWLPKQVEELSELTAELINEESCVILFPELNEGQEEEDVKKAVEVLKPVAEPIFEEAKAREEQPPVRFLVGGESEIADSLKDFLNIDEDHLPQLILVDIPANRIHKNKSEEITTDTIRSVVEAFLNDKLDFESLQG